MNPITRHSNCFHAVYVASNHATLPPATAMTTTSNPPSLSDPSLQPFTSSTFSPTTYLDSILPPLSPPAILTPTRRPDTSAATLASLSTQTTTLLSTLDVHTQHLLTHLQTLSDEILRLTPRLGYEIDVLRSDAEGLKEVVEKANDGETGLRRVIEDEPEGLKKLMMLSKVRERVEEVVKVFGEAMEWRVEGDDGGGEGSEGKDKKSQGKNPAEEVGFLIAAGELEKAKEKVERLRKLASVFQGTVEGPARVAVVEALERRVEVERRKVEASRRAATPVETKQEEKKVDEKKDDGGYFGLISRFTS